MVEREREHTDRIRVLLVDDEQEYVNILAKRMIRRDLDVAKAYSGSEAIQVLRKADFDVAVLDLKMEDMDGIEVTRRTREWSKIPIII